MTNYSAGHSAEKVAAKYLQDRGYKIVALNWSTPACEIDIVAQKGATIYFVEVKYRSQTTHGGGLDYITPKKLQQMQFAAQCWIAAHKYDGDYELSALEVGADFVVTEFIETLT